MIFATPLSISDRLVPEISKTVPFWCKSKTVESASRTTKDMTGEFESAVAESSAGVVGVVAERL